jgi:hypothetical protein
MAGYDGDQRQSIESPGLREGVARHQGRRSPADSVQLAGARIGFFLPVRPDMLLLVCCPVNTFA